MQIIDGRSLALKIRQSLKVNIAKNPTKPDLAIILVGDDQASQTYVRLKEEAAEEIGMHFQKFVFANTASQAEIIQTVQKINQDPKIHGLIVQLPLPKHLNADQIIFAIDPKKDADGFHPKNLEKFRDNTAAFAPVLCEGIWRLIDSVNQDLTGKKAVILANSTIFAEPMAILLTRQDLDTTIVYSPFKDFETQTKAAGVVVIAIGQSNFLKNHHIKSWAILIDVGFNRDGKKVVGDIDFESVKNSTGWITPVPGGVGPMTVAMLVQRVYELSLKI